MRKIVVNIFLTLDGVMQGPGGPNEDREGGFEHGGWSVNYWDDRMGRFVGEGLSQPFDLLLGRKTYDIFAAHWPHATDEAAGPLNAATKYVVSTTLASADWGPAVLIRDNVVEQITRLKQGDGPDLQVHGSSQLVQTLMANDLVDQFRVMIFPLTLGSGKQLFGDGVRPGNLRLVDSEVSTTGVIIATYEPAGDVRYGSFALEDQPTTPEVAP